MRNLDLMATTVWLWEALDHFRFGRDSGGAGEDRGGLWPVRIGL